VVQGAGGASAPQNFLFVKNAGKIPENLDKIPEKLGKIHENPGKIPENLVKVLKNPGTNGAQCFLSLKNGTQRLQKNT